MIFGLVVQTSVHLPDQLATHRAGPADVRIRLGKVARPPMDKPGLSVLKDASILNVMGVGRYEIRHGCEIIVDPDGDAPDRNVRLYLLGSAFGVILHQRGLLPLHANIIEIDGIAVIFMGHSGAGKSTMAAWFHDRGYRVLGDDVCVVDGFGSGEPRAHFGLPRLRLWREALEISGRRASDYDYSYEGMDKFDVPTQTVRAGAPLPLGAIYLLRKAEEGASTSIVSLLGVDALDALIANTYRGGYLKLLGGTERHFLQCLQLAEQVPIFKAERRWGYDAFDAEAKILEDHARSVAYKRLSRNDQII
jgi:hypothetical protein